MLHFYVWVTNYHNEKFKINPIYNYIKKKFKLGINSTMVKDLYLTLMRATENDKNKWKEVPCSWIWEVNSLQMCMLPEAIYLHGLMVYDLVWLCHATLLKGENGKDRRLIHVPRFRQLGSEQQSVCWEVGSLGGGGGLALINSLNNYLLRTYYIPGTVLGSRATAVNETCSIILYIYTIHTNKIYKSLHLCTFSEGSQTMNKQISSCKGPEAEVEFLSWWTNEEKSIAWEWWWGGSWWWYLI